MIDINSKDFMQDFDIEKATVGIVGQGYVGQAIKAFFENSPGMTKKPTIYVYDKAKPELGNLENIVKNAEVIFSCVPTPMKQDGSCHTGIVESVLQDIRNTAERLGRKLDSFVVVLKSTLPVGFTNDMRMKHNPMRITFSPEFLTEKNSVNDFVHTNRIVVGGSEEDAMVVLKYFLDCQPLRVKDNHLLLLQTDAATAEMVKLYANGILTAKVIFSNEVYQMCEHVGIDYEEVRALACLDGRIGASHTVVPGHDGKLGYGGSCFPKDINNLRHLAKVWGVPEKMFTAMIERNEALRPEKDWEQLKGRAVVEDEKN